ncbi:hypothetical protein CBW22_07655 [Pantoea sp. VS1]|uniref:hypothetical protein n=1 Tax=Pantoea sp. VS1 TaxID=2003658 RepID=UPI000B50A53A|nr:hypothetical protein [Pantoea sp. VS1]OWS76327.1 hypothetical protein CBW22_07655 [Pantoea sp. VS1]
MAKIIINIETAARGLSVDCQVSPADSDTQLVQHLAALVAAGLAVHVNEKIRNALTKKEKNNVH